MEYLRLLFIPVTSPSCQVRGARLLMGNSYFSPGFISLCADNNIHLFCIPPHKTYFLQPLDVGLFAPLQNQYSSLLEERMRIRQVVERKGNFIPNFHQAQALAYTQKNILSALEATGIHPLDQCQVLSKFTLSLRQLRSQLNPAIRITLATPSTPHNSNTVREMTLGAAQRAVQLGKFRLTRLLRTGNSLPNPAIRPKGTISGY